MANRRIAVVIGVNEPGVESRLPLLRYAQRDAEAVARTLCDPNSGTFDPSDVALFVGPDVRASAIKSKLRRLVRDSHETDLLVFYFAGHTVAPQWGSGATERYLVTPDLDEAGLLDDPEAGLRMTFLTSDVLEHFKGTSVLILDCCQAGGLATLRSPQPTPTSEPERNRRAVLTACSANAYAREDVDSQHGAFTRLVLQGLAGEAADKHGLVTFETLSTYVREQNLEPPPLMALQGQATILLTRLRIDGSSEPPSVRTSYTATPQSLRNPLDDSLSDLTLLVDRLARKARTRTADERTDTGPANVELIRSAIGAASVAHIRRADSTYGAAANFVAIDATAKFNLARFLPVLWACDNEGSPSRDREAFGYSVQEDKTTLWCVPLGHHKEQAQFLIVVDPPAWLEKIGQMAAKALQAIWHIGFARSPAETEVHVFTALRAVFGRLPEKLFWRSLDLYSEVLTAVRIVFQPIVTIGGSPKEVGIHGYEALARQSLAGQSAPVSLLKLAHTWGDHFVVERDKIILGKALTAYALAHGRSTWNQEIPKPVSINVSVRSLLDDSYVETLRQLIAQLELPPHVITLEISEQDAIEPWEGEEWEGGGANHSYYNGRLMKVSQALGVSFALDDFGTGHASLDRITGLPITHIKIDRTILFHRQAVEELNLVVSIARDGFDRGESHVSRPVIVEGVERDCPVSLKEIYASGIRHIQGYITEQRGAPDLRHLSLEVRNDIAARVKGDDGDDRPAGVARGDRARGGDSLRRTA